MEQARKILNDVEYAGDPCDRLAGAGAMNLVTEWYEFRAFDMKEVRALLKEPIVVDMRNIKKPDEMRLQGMQYVSE